MNNFMSQIEKCSRLFPVTKAGGGGGRGVRWHRDDKRQPGKSRLQHATKVGVSQLIAVKKVYFDPPKNALSKDRQRGSKNRLKWQRRKKVETANSASLPKHSKL